MDSNCFSQIHNNLMNKEKNGYISSIIKLIAEKKKLDVFDKKNLFKNDCYSNLFRNKEIPKKDSSLFRIVSYNVHMWSDPFNIDNVNQVFNLIDELSPDVLILEECGINKKKVLDEHVSTVSKEFKKLGYKFHFCGCKGFEIDNELYGNLIAVKNHLKVEFASKVYNIPNHEERCFVRTKIKNFGSKDLLIYGLKFQKKKKKLTL